MLYQDTQGLVNFLKAYNLWNKKELGQNFLVNLQILETICNAAELSPEDNVVEVGTGLGVLTEQLAKRAQHVTTIEYDPTLIPILTNEFKKFSNVELIHEDALHHPLPTTPYKLVANIPYYITSPLLNHFLQTQKLKSKDGCLFQKKRPQQKRPSTIVLLVQKEVAEKICAQDGDHSILSLQVQIFGKPSIVGNVNKSSFFPQPQVDSAIIKIAVYPEPLITNTELFFKITKAAFSQKRKTLLNSLQNGLQLPKEEIEKMLTNAGIEFMRRPQTLTIEEWEKLLAGSQN